MSPGILRLVVDLLDDYSERLSYDGCNDWDAPDYLTADDRADLSRRAWEANGRRPDERPTDDINANHVAVSAVQHMIRSAIAAQKGTR